MLLLEITNKSNHKETYNESVTDMYVNEEPKEEILKDSNKKNLLLYSFDKDILNFYGNSFIFFVRFKKIEEIIRKYNPKYVKLNYVDSFSAKIKETELVSGDLIKNLKKELGLGLYEKEVEGPIINKPARGYGGWITSEGYIVLPEMMHREYIMYKLGDVVSYNDAFKKGFVRFLSRNYPEYLGLEGNLEGLKKTFPIWSDYSLNARKIYIDIVGTSGELLDTKIIETEGLSKRKLYNYLSSLTININENGKRLYSSITLHEVPEKYRKLKLLNRGTTSLIYDYSHDKVLVLTKDRFKYEWLKKLFNDEITYIEDIDPKYNTIYKKYIGDKIDVFTMPKLHPLNNEEKKKVKKFIEKFYDYYYSQPNYHINKGEKTIEILRTLANHYNFYEFKDQLEKLYEFLLDYDPESFEADFQLKNFMKKSDGTIVFLDPVVDRELIIAYYGR